MFNIKYTLSFSMSKIKGKKIISPEKTLAKDWLSKEDEAAWKNL